MKKFVYLFTLFSVLISVTVNGQERLRLATTTSTDNSGLLAVLHPPFEKQHGVKIDVIAVGTGKALKLGENGDVDVVMVHAPAAEKQFVDAGFGKKRFPLMHNDFVIVGPAADPAGLKQAATLSDAMMRLSNSQAGFISRGDIDFDTMLLFKWWM